MIKCTIIFHPLKLLNFDKVEILLVQKRLVCLNFMPCQLTGPSQPSVLLMFATTPVCTPTNVCGTAM